MARERSRQFHPGPEYFLARQQIRTHRIGFHTVIGAGQEDTEIDLWDNLDPDNPVQFPLFQASGVITLESTNASDNGSFCECLGLDANGSFVFESIEIGGSAGTKVFSPPLAQIRLEGSSGDRSGAFGNISATSTAGIVGLVRQGRIKSLNGIRRASKDEQWIVKGVTAGLVKELTSGQTVANLTLRLHEAHPNERSGPQRSWSFTESLEKQNLRETFDQDSYFFATVESTIAGAIIEGYFSVGVVQNVS